MTSNGRAIPYLSEKPLDYATRSKLERTIRRLTDADLRAGMDYLMGFDPHSLVYMLAMIRREAHEAAVKDEAGFLLEETADDLMTTTANAVSLEVALVCGQCGEGPIQSSTNVIRQVGTLFQCSHCENITQPVDYADQLDDDEALHVREPGHVLTVRSYL